MYALVKFPQFASTVLVLKVLRNLLSKMTKRLSIRYLIYGVEKFDEKDKKIT